MVCALNPLIFDVETLFFISMLLNYGLCIYSKLHHVKIEGFIIYDQHKYKHG